METSITLVLIYLIILAFTLWREKVRKTKYKKFLDEIKSSKKS
jgi:hypothetical protein